MELEKGTLDPAALSFFLFRCKCFCLPNTYLLVARCLNAFTKLEHCSHVTVHLFFLVADSGDARNSDEISRLQAQLLAVKREQTVRVDAYVDCRSVFLCRFRMKHSPKGFSDRNVAL